MKHLSIDIETYSDQPLAKTGVYRYVESPVFEILLFSYSIDGNSVQLVDLACGEKIPEEVVSALKDKSVTKWAFNANFERICLSRHLGYSAGDYLDPESWRCSMGAGISASFYITTTSGSRPAARCIAEPRRSSRTQVS